MAKFSDQGELLRCSFCGKHQKQVKKLIAGPGAYICNECIDLCNEIITGEATEVSRAAQDTIRFERQTVAATQGVAQATKDVAGPTCPECGASLAETALLRKLGVPLERGPGPREVLFLLCSRCGLTIDDFIKPEERV